MDLDDEEYYYNKFIKTHISKKELKEKYISKDKIRDKIKKLKIECNKFCELGKILDCNTQCTIGGTIKALEDLLKE